MKEKVLMENMSWVEIKDAIENGKKTVLLISGSIEQHGPHLPTGTDTILGYEIAKRAARQLGNTLVAPVIRPCLSEHHMGFPGSFTLSSETYHRVLKDHCESLANCGFKDILLLSSHGGNTAVLTAIVPDIAIKLYGRANVHLIDYLSLSAEAALPFLEEKGISRAKAGVHAGYSETSLMLVASPRLVKMECAEKGLDEESFYDPVNLSRSQIDTFILGVKHYSGNGVLGDPRKASLEVGEKLMEIVVTAVVKAASNALGATPP
ncbi:MAG: creatininase family protein [Deltaproteobacteria bacterium]|nr:creatininase family protein [Deltaproteobacteria bacterium]MBW2154058.1 creatininase family protein [Deltaproteobacteria bacterium]